LPFGWAAPNPKPQPAVVYGVLSIAYAIQKKKKKLSACRGEGSAAGL
jgi:hypothetical protein